MQLFQPTATYTTHELAYNLLPIGKGLFLAEAFIAAIGKMGSVTYMIQKVQQKNVASFGFDITPNRKEIFSIINDLQAKNLEKKYNPPRRRPKSLLELLEDPDLKKKITQQVQQQVDRFLTLVKAENGILCMDVQKKVRIDDVRLRFAKAELQAHASFKRTPNGMEYQLQLGEEGAIFQINQRNVAVLCNEPAWVTVSNRVYQVAHINGNMLKPFIKKKKVQVPEKHIRTYFNFIKKVATKINIEAEGFAVVEERQLQSCELQLQQNIFDKSFGIQAKMIYPSHAFYWQDSKEQRVGVDFSDPKAISIRKVYRDQAAEKVFVQKLKALDLIVGTDNLFRPQGEVTTWYLPEWLLQRQQALRKAGFTIKNLKIDGSEVIAAIPKVTFGLNKGNDWLDIHGVVTVGKFEFPFLKLANHIRENDPLYRLPDGTYFLIPQEWLTKYKGLVEFAKNKEGNLRLSKSQFPLLKDLAIEGWDDKQEEEEDTFSPSQYLKATLRPYQLEGAKWLVRHHRNEFGACLADDMGLGKTLQTITLLLYAKEERQQNATQPSTKKAVQGGLFEDTPTDNFNTPLQALVVLPASLVYNWEHEIRKFAPTLSTYKHMGAKRHKDIRLIQNFDVILTTYQTALRDVATLEQLDLEYIVLDESQYIKNKDSKIFKAINKLPSRHRVSLSGTPIENSLSDLWAQMQFINPDLLRSFRFFKQEFITPIEKQGDEEKTERLRTLIQPFLLRRTKEMVAKDLPDLTEQVFYSEMTKEQKKLYEKEKAAARNYLLENYDATNFKFHSIVLTTLNKLRQIANDPRLVRPDYTGGAGKFADVMEQLAVLEKGEHKTLLFSTYVKHLELYEAQFLDNHTHYSKLIGSFSKNQRQQNIDKFEKDAKVKHFLISLKAGGTGLNLTAAEYVFILDPWYNPSAERQAIARAHRIGQTKNVMAIKFITKGTIEEKILKMQEKKAQLVEDIIESRARAKFTKRDIEFLLE